MTHKDFTRNLRSKRYDLPLHRGSGGQLVTWVVGVMTYLTVLLLVLIFALNMIQTHWQQSLTGKLTVEIPYHANDAVREENSRKITEALNTLPQLEARVLDLGEMEKLVGTWLGDSASLAELPLPTLIDVTLKDIEQTPSIETITSTVQNVVPEAAIDTHQEWLADLTRLAKACGMILISISIILAITSALTVAATARTRLALHKDEVALLHLIGATDSYIANQFQRQAFRLATEGAAGGLFIAIVTMAIVNFAKSRLGDTVVPTIQLGFAEWACLLLTPVFAGIVAMIASRFAVLHALKRMP